MRYVVDTNIINWLVDGAIQPEVLPEEGEFVATHVQVDELNDTPDRERRAQLFLRFTATVDDVVPTESMVVGISRVGLSKVSDGGLYYSIKGALDKKRTKLNNAQDALIAEVAIKNNYVLLTADRDLSEVAKDHGCTVKHFAP
jgi:predicted nucleic acid-binding protein